MQLYQPFFLIPLTTVVAEVMKLDSSPKLHQRCTGIWEAHELSGLLQPSIIIQMDPILPASENHDDVIVSIVIFELSDEHLGGYKPAGTKSKEIICTPGTVESGICATEQLGSFVVTPEAFANANRPIISRAVRLNDPEILIYPVQKQGFYCTATYGYSGREYSGLMTVWNFNGLLPAFQLPCLYLYKYLSVAAILWSLAYVGLWAYSVKERGLESMILHTLAFLSLLNVTIRWAHYASHASRGSTAILGCISTVIESSSVVALGCLLFVFPQSGNSPYSWAITTTSVTYWVATGALAAATTYFGINELHRTAESIPIPTAVLGGVVAVGFSWMSLCTYRVVLPELKQNTLLAENSFHTSIHWTSVSGAILSLILTVTTITAILSTPQDSAFAAKYWTTRWLQFDEAPHLLILLCSLSTMVTYTLYFVRRKWAHKICDGMVDQEMNEIQLRD